MTQNKPVIQRYLSDENLKRFLIDFSFLIKSIKESCGEYDLALRDNYFNIYYKGNSLAKVTFDKGRSYKIKIHSKFFDNTKADDKSRYTISKENLYRVIKLDKKQLYPFLKNEHLKQFASQIKKVNYGEEITFEQVLITDNLNKTKFLFIDRQIQDKKQRKRLDLLGLRQVEGNKYQFVVSEVKLGNNNELKEAVFNQLKTYVDHIKANFKDYKDCYEKHYSQKRLMGLFELPSFDSIEIVEPIDCMIIVLGYSGIGKKQIEEFSRKYPSIEIKQFTYELF